MKGNTVVILHRLTIAAGLTLLASAAVNAAHHEKETIAPAAAAGQVIVVYEWPCRDTEAAVGILKKLIAYEAGATPIPYSSVPVVHNPYNVGAVDVHSSMESFEKAGKWQANDTQWQEMLQEMATGCGSPVENLDVKVLPTR